ncbi:hypothetical protein HFO74_22820 [Rhizobium laguerreae]|uniref:Uncharacterized protein n=1 Tax=Rhizobium laguerreae TaxID=1076926 RepID=A0AB35FIS1_9HYPH|nr:MULTISPECIES: hypothetical protein [Rhizobium]MBY3066217.1 hypothetical protein [Rhizobium laguerreae]MBY3080686.1 hypothetical protein [Rhizobium laguerreae]MBY3114154.1 hypothetical protein [Rhizobium laguerreae]MBY3240594.1 hypothetical protein [Rhizobium laguerreae]MBY3302079.1 hypothetical protein [Rhizobium laguerreae]
MSTFDSTLKINRAGVDALLARDALDGIEFEDAIAGEDTQWEPMIRHWSVDAAGRNTLTHITYITPHEVDSLSTTWTKANSFRAIREEAYARIAQWHSGRDPNVAQKVVRELGRLKNGWAGLDSVAPSGNILRDIQLVASSLPSSTRSPDVEVDPDDGSVVLRWMQQAALRSFSLTFVGEGWVTGFYSADDSSAPAWRLKASDSIRLAIKFSPDNVQSLLTQ